MIEAYSMHGLYWPIDKYMYVHACVTHFLDNAPEHGLDFWFYFTQSFVKLTSLHVT